MNFEQHKSIIEFYIGAAQSHMQISAAALGLSITFLEKLLGEAAVRRRDPWLMASWVFFLLAIGAGAFYQYLAIKWLDSISDDPGGPGFVPEFLRQNPGKLFAAMQIFFYVGAVLFVISAIRRMRKNK